MGKFAKLGKNNFVQELKDVKVLKLTQSNFENIRDKDYIQHAYSIVYQQFHNYFENGLRMDSFGMQQCRDLNKNIVAMKKDNKFLEIFQQTYRDLGPGEVLMYLLHDKIHLAGGTQGGDLRIGTKKIELKAAKIKQNPKSVKGPLFYSFMMGQNDMSDTVTNLKRLIEAAKLKFEGTSIKTSTIDFLRNNFKGNQGNDAGGKPILGFDELEKLFQKQAHEQYFKKYQFMFVGQKPGQKDGEESNVNRNFGRIIGYIEQVKPKDIFIENFSRGDLKPMVRGKVIQ